MTIRRLMTFLLLSAETMVASYLVTVLGLAYFSKLLNEPDIFAANRLVWALIEGLAK